MNETLFPAGKPYKLMTGRDIRVMPWSVETIGLVAQRLPDFIEKVTTMDADTPVITLIPDVIGEIKWLLSVSSELTEDEVSQLPAEDAMGLLGEVLTYCLEGPLGKLPALMTTVTGLISKMAGPEETPSSSPSTTSSDLDIPQTP